MEDQTANRIYALPATMMEADKGFCTSVTRTECEAIAKARNVRLVEIRNPNVYLFPAGCYQKNNNRMYFNIQHSKKQCSWRRRCICKKEKLPVPATKPAKPATKPAKPATKPAKP